MGVFANNNVTAINLIPEVHIDNLNLIGKDGKKMMSEEQKGRGKVTV